MKQSMYPPGWDEKRVKEVLAHYESQIEEEAVAEDEVAPLARRAEYRTYGAIYPGALK